MNGDPMFHGPSPQFRAKTLNKQKLKKMKNEAKKIRGTWWKRFMNVTMSRRRCRFQSKSLSRTQDNKMKNAPIECVDPLWKSSVRVRTLKAGA
jgi:hypothetical protein